MYHLGSFVAFSTAVNSFIYGCHANTVHTEHILAFKGVHTLKVWLDFKTNSGSISAVFSELLKHSDLNFASHQTSGPRTLKRQMFVFFQSNSGPVRLKYEHSTDQRYLNKTINRNYITRRNY